MKLRRIDITAPKFKDGARYLVKLHDEDEPIVITATNLTNSPAVSPKDRRWHFYSSLRAVGYDLSEFSEIYLIIGG